MGNIKAYGARVCDTARQHLLDVARVNGDGVALAAAAAAVRASAQVTSRLAGDAAAIEMLYRAADAVPLPDARGAQRVPHGYHASRQARFWRIACDMLDRIAYVTASLVLGAVFTLWH